MDGVFPCNLIQFSIFSIFFLHLYTVGCSYELLRVGLWPLPRHPLCAGVAPPGEVLGGEVLSPYGDLPSQYLRDGGASCRLERNSGHPLWG